MILAKKVIAVASLWDKVKESIWMLTGSMDGITEAGVIPVILPLFSDGNDAVQILDSCNGLLMAGGQDVSPEVYGEFQKETCAAVCPERDPLKTVLYRWALE